MMRFHEPFSLESVLKHEYVALDMKKSVKRDLSSNEQVAGPVNQEQHVISLLVPAPVAIENLIEEEAIVEEINVNGQELISGANETHEAQTRPMKSMCLFSVRCSIYGRTGGHEVIQLRYT